MNNFTTGGFGYANSGSGSFTNLNGMYAFGSNQNMPAYNQLQPANMQYFFNNKSQRPFVGFHSPPQVMQNYGLKSILKYRMLGLSRPLGVSRQDTELSRQEYGDLFARSTGFDIASFAANSLGLGAGMAMGGFAGVATGGLGLVIPAVVNAAKETYMGNYRNTQMVSSAMSNFIGKDGGTGYTGKETVDLSKFISKSAAHDVLIDKEQAFGLFKAGADEGLYSGAIDEEAVKRKFKNLKNIVEKLSNITGNGDLKSIVKSLGDLQRLNIGQSDAIDVAGKIRSASAMSGVSSEGVRQHINASIMISSQLGRDQRTTMQDTLMSHYIMPALRQHGDLPTNLLNKETYFSAAAQTEVNQYKTAKMYQGGMTKDVRLLYALELNKKTGKGVQSTLDKLDSENPSQVIKEIGSYAKGNYAFQMEITNPTSLKSKLASFKHLEKYHSASDIENNIKAAQEEFRGTSHENNVDDITERITGPNASSEVKSYTRAMVKEWKRNPNFFKNRRKAADRIRVKREITESAALYEEKHSLVNTIAKGWDIFKEGFSDNFIGGQEASGEMTDESRTVYGMDGHKLSSAPTYNFNIKGIAQKDRRGAIVNFLSAGKTYKIDSGLSLSQKPNVKRTDTNSLATSVGTAPNRELSYEDMSPLLRQQAKLFGGTSSRDMSRPFMNKATSFVGEGYMFGANSTDMDRAYTLSGKMKNFLGKSANNVDTLTIGMAAARGGFKGFQNETSSLPDDIRKKLDVFAKTATTDVDKKIASKEREDTETKILGDLFASGGDADDAKEMMQKQHLYKGFVIDPDMKTNMYEKYKDKGIDGLTELVKGAMDKQGELTQHYTDKDFNGMSKKEKNAFTELSSAYDKALDKFTPKRAFEIRKKLEDLEVHDVGATRGARKENRKKYVDYIEKTLGGKSSPDEIANIISASKKVNESTHSFFDSTEMSKRKIGFASIDNLKKETSARIKNAIEEKFNLNDKQYNRWISIEGIKDKNERQYQLAKFEKDNNFSPDKLSKMVGVVSKNVSDANEKKRAKTVLTDTEGKVPDLLANIVSVLESIDGHLKGIA